MVVAPDVRRELWRLALPVIGLNLLGVLSLGIDMAMCGHLPDGQTALAALGFATQVVLASNVVVLGLTVGAVSLIARAHGARDPERVSHVLGQALIVTTVVAILVGVGLNLVASPLLTALGARGTVRALGLDYLRPMLALSLFHFLQTLLAGAMRAVGRTTTPFTASLVTTALHVVLAYALIYGELGAPRLGVTGAAMSAVLSQAVAVIILFGAVRRGSIAGLSPTFDLRSVDGALVRKLVTVGLPAALDMLIIHGSFLVIVAMLSSFGDASVAANSVGLRVQSLAFVPGLAISQATAAMVGASLGAKNVARARSVAWAAVWSTVGLMIALGVGLALLSPAILALFAVHPGTEIHALATTWMYLLGVSLPIAGANIALVGVLRGAGATTTSLMVNVVGTLLMQVPLSYLLGHMLDMGALGIWIAVPVAFASRLALSVIAYRRGAWAEVGV